MWLASAMVFFLNSLLSFAPWQQAIMILLCFLVLTAELFNCAVEHTLDASDLAFSDLAEKAKDMAAGGVFLISVASLIIFLQFLLNNDEWYHSLANTPLLWATFAVFSLVNLFFALLKSSPLVKKIYFTTNTFFICLALWFGVSNPKFLAMASMMLLFF